MKNETIIRIDDESGQVMVERAVGGVKSFKQIDPDALVKCINQSLLRNTVSSGLLPRGCLSFASCDDGSREVHILHPESRANITFFDAEYKDFPLPRLAFGFRIGKEGRIYSCRLGVAADDEVMKPSTKMYHYPLSNVRGTHLCLGNNVLPKCTSLHTLSSLPYLIMAMPNNLDGFSAGYNKLRLEMRDLLELLKDKDGRFYYSDVLIPSGKTLGDFIVSR